MSKQEQRFPFFFNESQELVQLQTAEQTIVYQRDALGRVTQKRIDQEELNYSYDAIGRLVQANEQSFNYDKAGNLQSPQHHYDTKKNQLLEDATYIYTYDERGNLKGKVNKTNNHYTYYTFNGLNQLTAVYRVNQDDEIVHYLRYEYDAFNRRVSKEENTVIHYYLYDKENIIAILNENRQTLATIVHHPTLTDTPLSITNVNGTFYYHRDHQGSIIALTDEAGQIVEHITYDNTYGKVLNHFKQEENLTLNPYGYTGREMDAEDLYYYRARYYDPNTQRFLSLDPIGFEAGDFNFYRYVENDPVNFRDPWGLWPWDTNKSISAEDAKDAIGKTRGYGKIFDKPGHNIGEKGVDFLTKESCDKYNALVDILGKKKANEMYPCKDKTEQKKPSDVVAEAAQKSKDKNAHKEYCECMAFTKKYPDLSNPKMCASSAIVGENQGAKLDTNCSQ